MSASPFYQILGLHGYTVTRVSRDERMVTIEATPQPHLLKCPCCGGKDVVLRGSEVRLLRNLPIGRDCSWVRVVVPRVGCRACGAVRQINLGIAEPRRTYTRAFERYVLELCGRMTIQDVALHLCVSWDIVKDIHKRRLRRRYAKPRLRQVRRIGIDEICVGHGHKYRTLVLDFDTGAILFVGEGKGAAALDPFWRRLRASHARVKAVAMDMSAAYRNAVERHLPRAAIVFDRFHIVKLVNEKLTQLRRDLHREAVDRLKKQVLKGIRWLLLKRPENLDPERDERRRLQEALRLNESLSKAYYLKEDLAQLWEMGGKDAARRHLESWYLMAMDSGVRIMQDLARTLMGHKANILAWFDHPISNGPLEGTNNKIRAMTRQHYGLRDSEYFELKLYNLHEAKYALVG
jgi:transposase